MESDLIVYSIKVIGLHGIFFFLYRFGFKRRVDYQSLRFYLIAAFFIAFFIPSLSIYPVDERPLIHVEEIGSYFFESPVASKQPSANDLRTISSQNEPGGWITFRIVYFVGAALLIGKFFLSLILLYLTKLRSELVNNRQCKIYKTSKNSPFSFFSNIFIPKELFGTTSFRFILAHEYEHVRRYHSIDRVMMDLVATLFWFNPFIYFYRNALIEIHEYQADDAVIKKFHDPIGYQEVLYAQLQPDINSGLMSHFNFSTIKKRIVMINSNENAKSRKALLLAVPVLVLAIVGFAKAPEKHQVVLDELVEPLAEEVFVEEQVPTQNNKPSILPLGDASKMRVSSTFGMRKDPYDGEHKMHSGLDMVVPEGTSVIATADGVVHNTAENIGGYGNFVLIKHGEKYMSRYSQLFSISVQPGDEVKMGEEIGKSGNSGRSTGPHLHYEVIEVGVGHQDPMKFITDYEFRSIP